MISDSNKYSFSSLRSVDAQADKEFYNQLTDRVLVTILQMLPDNLTEDATTTLADLKGAMGINYKVLTKIISSLAKRALIKVKINGSSTDYQPEDVSIQLTSAGKGHAKDVLCSFSIT